MKNISLILGLIVMFVSLAGTNRVVFYHNNYGMIDEAIEIPLERGVSVFEFQDLPNSIDDNTVMLTPSGRASFTVDTQSYSKPSDRHSFMNIRGSSRAPNMLPIYFRENIGKEIEVVLTDGSIISGVLIHHDHSMVGIYNNASKKNLILRQSEIRNFIMPQTDFNFNPIPYLSWKLRADRKADYSARLAYLCTGFSWEGLYRGVWDDETLKLEIFAKLDNNSGKDINDYTVMLIAGEPKRATLPVSRAFGRGVAARSLMVHDSMEASPEFTTETFDEYHLFTYSEPIKIADQQTKQIRLYEPKVLKPAVHYEYQTESNYINTILKIQNDKRNNMGIALPKGRVQLYREHKEDNVLTFIGEDYVPQTPVNEEWLISPGRAFDVVGKTTTLETRNPARNVTEKDMAVSVKNNSDKTRNIEVVHTLRGNWTISRNSLRYERKDASTIIFKKELRADEELIITWTERQER